LAAKKLKQDKCEKCGIKDRSLCECCGNRIYLHVNHIKPFATYLDLRFNPQNASVLCPKCHLGLQ
jgi:5-methylcytosine-specific restriction endonuclease McrA